MFSLLNRDGGAPVAPEVASRKVMAEVHCVAEIVVGHCVGVMVVEEVVAPDGVSEMVLVSE